MLKAVQKHNTKLSWISLRTSWAGVYKCGDIHMECRSADIDNVERLQGNNCQLKKWYCERQRTSDERRTMRRMVE